MAGFIESTTEKEKTIRDQLETIQDTILPLQDAILRLAQYAATVTAEAPLAVMNATLEEMRKADKELRDRLFVLQVAKKFDWETANKMARRKAGEYEDPELAKVLEEKERKEDKAKRQREKEKKHSAFSPNYKRGRYSFSGAGPSTSRGAYQGYVSPLASAHPQEQGQRGYGRPTGYGYKPQGREELCNNCHQKGHFWKNCPKK